MKKLIRMVFVGCVLCGLSACANKQESSVITLNYWTHDDPARTELETRLIAEFEASNPSIKVVRTTQGPAKLIELVQTAFAEKRGPDIFNLSIEHSYSYISNARVAPVNPQAAGYKNQQAIYDNYLPEILNAVTKGGKIYGLPLEITNWCIYINKKVFRSVGLDPERDYPKTWEDMVRISEKLVIRDGDVLIRRGFDFRYPYYLVAFVPMVEQLGGKLISDDGKTAIVGDAAWIKFLTFMQQWGPSGKNLGSPTYKNARNIFNKDNNDIGMTATGLYQQGRIEKDNPEFYASKEWMVVPFPVFEEAVNNVPACYYGHFLMVNNDIPKEKQDAAWKLIGFLLSHGEDYLKDGGNIIQPTKVLLNSGTLKNMPYSDVFISDMNKAHMVYYGARSAELQTAIRSAVESVMLSGVSPEKALATLKAAAQAIIDEN
ncbi:extracellular solute-binding protein [Treponema phagedenis]|uniref:ABC transporter, solute-binding protein n=1 Tax=Treponema phagedenis TaxID=162 RepID=A0A0B7GWG8_TREPH|nr:extracellular solute-binding protein [Treponema phagedenis]NVP25118.1 extracellular solute-binding protein [Treponema phagedenis]QEJ94119.1 extracellular solute-binding protein [Treponema phagedenis]QEJ97232.1 extracellular solute-binding protein [Treponema phagedenis]QEK01870.1 extracellular solute-binding protein [Treponema phagedenis]QEK02575.1 extracellular solute-binding protein [Treponema phagedenis]